MLKYKEVWKKAQWLRISRKIVVQIAVVIIVLFPLGIDAQEKVSEVTSLSSGQVIYLNVNQMDLRDVLRLIAEKADLNIIMGKEVTGVVTLRLKNVDLWQALRAILEINGFTYWEKGGIIRVVKLGEVIEEEPTPEKKPVLVTEIIGLKCAEAAEMMKVSRHLLSPSGVMEIDAQSNVLIITDSFQNIEKVRQLVAELDTGVLRFDLMGILSASDHSLVMINNKILKVGEMIGDFTVSEIGEDSVSLTRGDQTITMRLGEELHAVEK